MPSIKGKVTQSPDGGAIFARLWEPLPANWQLLYRAGDRVKMIRPEPFFNIIPVGTEGTMKGIELEGVMAEKGRPYEVTFDLTGLNIPLPLGVRQKMIQLGYPADEFYREVTQNFAPGDIELVARGENWAPGEEPLSEGDILLLYKAEIEAMLAGVRDGTVSQAQFTRWLLGERKGTNPPGYVRVTQSGGGKDPTVYEIDTSNPLGPYDAFREQYAADHITAGKPDLIPSKKTLPNRSDEPNDEECDRDDPFGKRDF